jgi:hypothetical protein
MLQKLRNLRELLGNNPELGDGILEILDDIIKDAEVETIKVYEEKALSLIKENI